MNSITRRTFFGRISTLPAAAILLPTGDPKSVPHAMWGGGKVENLAFRLLLSPKDGLKNTRITHQPTGLSLADGDYSYSFGRPKFKQASISQSVDGLTAISMQGIALEGRLEVVQRFHVPRDHPWIEEQVTISNPGIEPLSLQFGRCGFVLPIALFKDKVTGAWSKFKLTAIPYRREPNGSRRQYADFPFSQILTEQYSSELWTNETTVTPAYASEGWALTDGERGFLITKYSQKGMEWSLVDRAPLDGNRTGFRWGGYGIYRGNPEHGAWLMPGMSHRFGVTRLTAYDGGRLEGFYTFRKEMAERGHGCPANYDPPIHWNELYDNKLWWLPDDEQDDPAMRKKYYTLDDMKEEAEKAKAIGCEALYMDPGWDTSFGSKIWDKARLGPYPVFTQMLQRDYDLKSSLHTPLSGWCDPTSYPPEMYRMDRFGQRLEWKRGMSFTSSPLCGASSQYLDETARRLKVLAKGGTAFFMFDGTEYHAECWDPNHGHRVPARREEHSQGLCSLARMVHAEYPDVLIEMHDPIVGGSHVRYAPTYYGHGRAPQGEPFTHALGFDEVWAFELMWQPMDDLLSGRAIALYYYNLAYALPLYIHIDLRSDNSNGLVFWWYASTCRHLGIGGTPKDSAVNKTHYDAMATYRRLEPLFKRGKFFGINEMTHIHVHPTESSAVIDCFNLQDNPIKREVLFVPSEYGFDGDRSLRIEDVRSRRTREGYVVTFNIPALGHSLARIYSS